MMYSRQDRRGYHNDHKVYQHHDYDRRDSEDTNHGSRDSSKLTIEIPASPQVEGKNARSQQPGSSQDQSQQPLDSNGYAGSKTPRVIAAEKERQRSQARHQILKEISQATSMKSSALDEKDRKFWERQIATLNESFKKL
ncbi:hypothetical protein ACHAWF_018430 [Thalassiosira exigua]